jgi:hypothetical protein
LGDDWRLRRLRLLRWRLRFLSSRLTAFLSYQSPCSLKLSNQDPLLRLELLNVLKLTSRAPTIGCYLHADDAFGTPFSFGSWSEGVMPPRSTKGRKV